MSPRATAAAPAELDLYREWREPITRGRILRDAAGSILFHVAVILFVVLTPEGEHSRKPSPQVTRDVTKAVHLVAPKFFEPTQKAPNKGKVTRELDVRSALPAPAPQAPRFRPPAPAPGPVVQAPPPVVTPPIEPPKIQAAEAPPAPVVTPSQQPPVAPPPPDKPKLAFESVTAQPVHVTAPNPNVQIPIPKPSIQSGAGGTIVGDIGDTSMSIPNAGQTSSAGRIGSNLQLLSDPKGVDFKPYLIQILTAVRRNWLAIIPESARMGRRGRVLIQFAIDRTGGVPKLVIAEGAGTDALDRAAVAAISASYPFPPLPADYKGDQIRVQLAFSYNMPTR